MVHVRRCMLMLPSTCKTITLRAVNNHRLSCGDNTIASRVNNTVAGIHNAQFVVVHVPPLRW